MNIDTTGLQELIFSFFEMIANLDLKSLNFDYLSTALTFFAPVMNPIWAAVNQWLEANFGF